MKKNDIVVEDVLQESIKLPESLFGMDKFNNSHFFLGVLFDIRGVMKYKHNYVGCFIDDKLRDHNVERGLFCLCRFGSLEGGEYELITKYFNSRGDFKFSYYAGMSNGYNLIMFVLSSENPDYDKIVSGKYSKVSPEYVKRLGSFPFMYNTRKRLTAIIRKADWHREEMEMTLGMDLGDGELWGRFEPEREIFRYEKIKEDIRTPEGIK